MNVICPESSPVKQLIATIVGLLLGILLIFTVIKSQDNDAEQLKAKQDGAFVVTFLNQTNTEFNVLMADGVRGREWSVPKGVTIIRPAQETRINLINPDNSTAFSQTFSKIRNGKETVVEIRNGENGKPDFLVRPLKPIEKTTETK